MPKEAGMELGTSITHIFVPASFSGSCAIISVITHSLSWYTCPVARKELQQSLRVQGMLQKMCGETTSASSRDISQT